MSETPFDDDAFWGTPEISCTTTTTLIPKFAHGSENSSHEVSSPMVKSMNDPSSTSTLPTLKDSPSAISFVEFWGGPEHSSLPVSSPPGDCGPGHALANLSPRQAKEKGLLMSATFGQPSSGSSSSVVLQQCLANKLRQRLDVNGSPEYVLTWKDWPMKWGPPICALRASARRTSDNGCSGWPTARTTDGTGDKAPPGRTGGPSLKQVAGWCSPTCQDRSRGGLPPRPQDTGVPLSQQAALTTLPFGGWPTTTTRDHKDGDAQSCANVPSNCLLGRVVHLTSGPTINLSPVGTAKRGALNPALSRWLMGYPVEWCQAAIVAFRKLKQQAKSGSPVSKGTATRLSAKSPPSSSSPPKTLGTTEPDDFWD